MAVIVNIKLDVVNYMKLVSIAKKRATGLSLGPTLISHTFNGTIITGHKSEQLPLISG